MKNQKHMWSGDLYLFSYKLLHNMKICLICLKIVFPHFTVTFYEKDKGEAKGHICVNCNYEYYGGYYLTTSPIECLRERREEYVASLAPPSVKEPE